MKSRATNIEYYGLDFVLSVCKGYDSRRKLVWQVVPITLAFVRFLAK